MARRSQGDATTEELATSVLNFVSDVVALRIAWTKIPLREELLINTSDKSEEGVHRVLERLRAFNLYGGCISSQWLRVMI